jgi:hypothetical protein
MKPSLGIMVGGPRQLNQVLVLWWVVPDNEIKFGYYGGWSQIMKSSLGSMVGGPRQ